MVSAVSQGRPNEVFLDSRDVEISTQFPKGVKDVAFAIRIFNLAKGNR